MGEHESIQREVIEQLWCEYLIARQYTAGSGRELIASVFGRKRRVRFGAPRWFVMVELGMGRDQGPSYFGVTRRLTRDNRKRVRLFEVEDEREAKASRPIVLSRSWGEAPAAKRRRRRRRRHRHQGNQSVSA
jgi:hypothetical protein